MIVHLTPYEVRTCLPMALSNNNAIGFVPPTESSWNAAQARIQQVTASESDLHADFLWHMDDQVDKDWMAEVFGYPRAQVRMSAAARARFLRTASAAYPSPCVCGPSGPPDDPDESRMLAQEAVAVRDAHFSDRGVMASFVFTRNGLRSGVPTSRMHPIDRRVDWISVAVEDTSEYPSTWTEEDWHSWLVLVGNLAAANYRVLVPYSDVRGLLALAVGAADFGTAASSKWRQLRPHGARRGGGTGGPTAANSYVSAPLLAIVNGDAASLLSEGGQVESHSGCLPFATLALHNQRTNFDPGWLATNEPLGATTKARLAQHFRVLNELERVVRTLSTADMQRWLDDAATLAQSLPTQIYKRPRAAAEIEARAAAFRSASATLGL